MDFKSEGGRQPTSSSWFGLEAQDKGKKTRWGEGIGRNKRVEFLEGNGKPQTKPESFPIVRGYLYGIPVGDLNDEIAS